MSLQEKYTWVVLYAVEFGMGYTIVSLFGLLGDFWNALTAVITCAVAYALIGIVHAFRIVYLKGKNSA